LVANAQDPQVKVGFSDLDLTRTQGAAALYGRIHVAAREVCAPLDGRSLREAFGFRTCVGEAVARAVTQVNNPVLNQYYQSRIEAHRNNPVLAAR
jgi:UrcA family protein